MWLTDFYEDRHNVLSAGDEWGMESEPISEQSGIMIMGKITNRKPGYASIP